MKMKITLKLMLLLLFMGTVSKQVQAQSCQASFTYTIDPNGVAVFNSTSTAQGGVGYTLWTIDGGIFYTTPVVTHQFLNNGVYDVCLIIGDANQQCFDTICQTVVVNIMGCNMQAVVTYSQVGNSLMVQSTGGIPPFNYLWSNGATTQTILADSSSTTYCATVTDVQGCSATDCEIVNPNCTMVVAIVADSLGYAAVATLGTPPYSYLWSNGSTQQQINPTATGSYCVAVTDAMGCVYDTCIYYTGNCNNLFTYTYVSPGIINFITTTNVGDTVVWDFGDGSALQTTTNNSILHTYSISQVYSVCMTVAGCPSYCSSIFIQGMPNSIICGNVFNDFNGNSLIDSLDTGIDSVYLFIYGSGIQQTIFTDANGNYNLNVPAGTYTLNLCAGGGNLGNGIITVPIIDTLSNCPSYQITIGANDTICGFNFGFFNNASTISGYLFFDVNSNGIMDLGELPISNQLIMIGGNYTYTNSNGYYSLMVTMGLYDIVYTPAGFFSSGLITTTAITVNVTQNGIIYGNNNIGLYMVPGQVDLDITIHPSTTVTPGFGAWYTISVCNFGTTPTGATVLMQYDSVLTPNYQSPAADVVNINNQLLTWNIASINPGSCVNLWVTFNALVGTPLGQSTMEFVSVSPTTGIDNNLNNNTDTIHQIVVGSWDPNNKLVDYTNLNNPAVQLISGIDPNQEIRYTINFQNTGNAPAHNVVVVDYMSAYLDINSYQFVGSSHACDVMRNGTITNYKFMNIMLPDSTNDEANSHGYVSFKVNALPGLNIGDQIVDISNIYFDFNAPVSTNDAVVTMVGLTGVPRINENDWAVYPNPANEFVSINLNTTMDGTGLLSVFDVSGKLVMQQDRELKNGFNKLIVNTSNLDKGMYVIQLTQANGKRIHSKLNIK